MDDTVKIRITEDISFFVQKFGIGEEYFVKLRPDGFATLLTGTYTFKPEQFEVVVDDKEFDKLLGQSV